MPKTRAIKTESLILNFIVSVMLRRTKIVTFIMKPGQRFYFREFSEVLMVLQGGCYGVFRKMLVNKNRY